MIIDFQLLLNMIKVKKGATQMVYTKTYYRRVKKEIAITQKKLSEFMKKARTNKALLLEKNNKQENNAVGNESETSHSRI